MGTSIPRDGPARASVSAEWTNDPAVNYVIGHAAVEYLWQTYGVERLVDLMRADSRREGYTADGDSHTRELLRKMYGTTEAQVVNGAFRLLSQSQH